MPSELSVQAGALLALLGRFPFLPLAHLRIIMMQRHSLWKSALQQLQDAGLAGIASVPSVLLINARQRASLQKRKRANIMCAFATLKGRQFLNDWDSTKPPRKSQRNLLGFHTVLATEWLSWTIRALYDDRHVHSWFVNPEETIVLDPESGDKSALRPDWVLSVWRDETEIERPSQGFMPPLHHPSTLIATGTRSLVFIESDTGTRPLDAIDRQLQRYNNVFVRLSDRHRVSLVFVTSGPNRASAIRYRMRRLLSWTQAFTSVVSPQHMLVFHWRKTITSRIDIIPSLIQATDDMSQLLPLHVLWDPSFRFQ